MKIASRARIQKRTINRSSRLIPMRSANYFANAYSKAEIREENRLAKASVIRATKDLN
jgi:hypothetical protein